MNSFHCGVQGRAFIWLFSNLKINQTSWCYQWTKRSAAAKNSTSTKKALRCTDRVSCQNKRTTLALEDHHEEGRKPRSPNQNTYRTAAESRVSAPRRCWDAGRACSVRGHPRWALPHFAHHLRVFGLSEHIPQPLFCVTGPPRAHPLAPEPLKPWFSWTGRL